MIEHIVMWKFADMAQGNTKEENMRIVRERLLALPAIIPQIRMMQIGKDISHTEMSYDMVLRTRFLSPEDLHTYKVHPAHQAVSAFVKEVRTARVVLDAELSDTDELQ